MVCIGTHKRHIIAQRIYNDEGSWEPILTCKVIKKYFRWINKIKVSFLYFSQIVVFWLSTGVIVGFLIFNLPANNSGIFVFFPANKDTLNTQIHTLSIITFVVFLSF